MNLIVHIPDELADRLSGVDPEYLERVALDAVLHATGTDARFSRAVAGVASNLSPREAAARMRAARPGNSLPPDVSIRDLMTDGRA